MAARWKSLVPASKWWIRRAQALNDCRPLGGSDDRVREPVPKPLRAPHRSHGCARKRPRHPSDRGASRRQRNRPSLSTGRLGPFQVQPRFAATRLGLPPLSGSALSARHMTGKKIPSLAAMSTSCAVSSWSLPRHLLAHERAKGDRYRPVGSCVAAIRFGSTQTQNCAACSAWRERHRPLLVRHRAESASTWRSST